MKLLLAILLICPILSFAQQPPRYSILITELMADPTPVVGLPIHEWVELKNTSNSSINLEGWRIGDATNQSGPMPAYILAPDSMVIVCANSAISALSVFGSVIAVSSFPSLDNDGDILYLRTADNRIMHSLQYHVSWYQNELKKEGGWSLEMIDTHKPCSGMNNWTASVDPRGGTPGQVNSVQSANSDQAAPLVLRAYSPDALSIVLVLNEPVDSASSTINSSYTISPGNNITAVEVLPPLFNQVRLSLQQPQVAETVYEVTASGLRDCAGNSAALQMVKTGLEEQAAPHDIVINEILFNPSPNGDDYVEIFNRGGKIIDAAKIYLANRNSNGDMASPKLISPNPFLLFPGDHVVITTDLANLQLNYLVKYPGKVLSIASLPSFPDAEGTVVITDFQGLVLDEVKYHRNWHFKLLDSDEGVALERIDPDAPSQQPSNWQSAASTAGFGTPTYTNSQYRQVGIHDMNITVTPNLFSPDNDGHDDFTLVKYMFEEPGFVANVTIFDGAGRPVRHLVKNSTLAQEGNWKWDGLNDHGNSLPVGQYIVFAEVFNLAGKKRSFKKVVVLAKRF